ncbi:hypothetical protein LAZ67_1002073 [Cordylochernes scorpioides]|uniref:Mos1 transposase HTH domain-containing protein n=1 Tax=Cordylochernes scorpioides TaxID=51811 RepID=A0ABY6JW25_9ARAC|nr:hypothetical protein LAZ67_1002073 [Cordylochernes scorpioides]
MYLGILRRRREAIRKKRPEKWTNGGWILHHDNARPHTAHLMTSFLAKNGTQILLQPPYFPDIAPNDFFLFPKLKAVLKGRHFDTRDDIIEKSPLALKSIPKEAYKNCFDNWEKRWRWFLGGKNQHFRHLLYFAFHRGQKAAEAARGICNMYGKGVIGERAPKNGLQSSKTATWTLKTRFEADDHQNSMSNI